MEPKTQDSHPLDQQSAEADRAEMAESEARMQAELTPVAPPEVERGIEFVLIGRDGLRAGWSVVIFVIVLVLVAMLLGSLLLHAHLLNPKAGFAPRNLFFNELSQFVALLVAATVMAFIERRRVMDYNLRGPRRSRHFFSGIVVGFAALTTLVCVLAAGHWLQFVGVLTGAVMVRYGLFWGCVFLMVGCVEEGAFRCYLQYTLTRGLNFWWALTIVALLCGRLVEVHKGNGVWGDYALALLGLVPCYLLDRRGAAHSAFWQAAWVTSTLFGFVHTGNGGENWIGIFAAGAIGFVFCVSVRLTGSAWWAIGAHAGWDWGETFFYGTPDSGLVAKGHYFSTTAVGNPLWSGGTDGPEGSLLVIGIIALLLVWLLAVYGQRGAEATAAI